MIAGAMEISKAIAYRLIYARMLIQNGSNLIRRRQVGSAGFGILGLQDGIEMALRAVAEFIGCSDIKEQIAFDQLISTINAKTPDRPVPRRQAITRLNKARVSFKHLGILPTEEDAAEFALDAEIFYSELVPLYVGLRASSFSVVDLIGLGRAHRALKAAENCYASDDFVDAVWWTSRAFVVVFGTVGLRLPDFSFAGASIKVDGHFANDVQCLAREVGGAIEALNKRTTALQEAIVSLSAHLSMLESGLDLVELRRFSSIAPSATMNSSGTIFIQDHLYQNRTIAAADAKFAIDFAIRSILNAPELLKKHAFASRSTNRKVVFHEKTEVFLAEGFDKLGRSLCALEAGTEIFAEGDQWDRSGLLHFYLDREHCVIALDAAQR